MLQGPKSTQKLAASMRREMTLPEVLLWRELRKRPGELKFRRQHPSGRYGLDFFCASARLAGSSPPWRSGVRADQLTIGIEEEFMLLDPADWSLAFRSDEVLAELPPELAERVTPETTRP